MPVLPADVHAAAAPAAPLADCAMGLEPCSCAKDKICLIQRGVNYFCQKVLNCMAGGGAGVVIYQRDDIPDCQPLPLRLELMCETPQGEVALDVDIPVVALSKRQGKLLKGMLKQPGQVNVTIAMGHARFDVWPGTSMAAPHVTGVAGVLWAAYPKCNNTEIRTALQRTAIRPPDSPGVRDPNWGYGLVQAKAALDYLAAHPCAACKTSPSPASAPARSPAPSKAKAGPPPRKPSASPAAKGPKSSPSPSRSPSPAPAKNKTSSSSSLPSWPVVHVTEQRGAGVAHR